MRKAVCTFISLILLIGVLTACDSAPPPIGESPRTSITQLGAGDDPGFVLRHDWGPDPAIEEGAANSCIMRDSEVEGRGHLCRVIDGDEEVNNDQRNWLIEFSGGAGPIAASGDSNDQYGMMIVLDDGATFEGCWWRSPDGSFLCDYRARKQIVLTTDTSSWSYVLHKLWDWSIHTGNSLGCAGGIAGLWSGGKVTAPLLTGCADGPL